MKVFYKRHMEIQQIGKKTHWDLVAVLQCHPVNKSRLAIVVKIQDTYKRIASNWREPNRRRTRISLPAPVPVSREISGN